MEGRLNTLEYTKAEPLGLRNHPQYTEKWLAEKIAEDSGILGLGDVVVLDRERRQERAGRLDLLLFDPDNNRRFEVELMLGATDESHIIRTIEYWDIERRRYPAYEHCAVLVAEDITGRFLNLLALFAGTIPMIVIQLNALKIGNQIVLNFMKVLNQTTLRRDDEAEAVLPGADRGYWTSRSSSHVVELADSVLAIINAKSEVRFQLNYNKHFIGLTDGTRSNNFVHFRPRRQFLHVVVRISNPEEWKDKCESIGLAAAVEEPGSRMRVVLYPKDFKSHEAALTALVHQAVEEDQKS